VLTSAGAVQVTAPQVNDKRVDADTGERERFVSAILPAWARKTPKITEVLPLLYLHGLSSGDFMPALGQFLGSTKGLSGPVITKLTEQWKAEARAVPASHRSAGTGSDRNPRRRPVHGAVRVRPADPEHPVRGWGDHAQGWVPWRDRDRGHQPAHVQGPHHGGRPDRVVSTGSGATAFRPGSA
jgi:hypothetical protein